ncbi:MAG TPA: hypothetical protein VF002_09145 [Gaiellaceae bacterium]
MPQQLGLASRDEGDYVEFFRSRRQVAGIFRCVSCQQAVIVRGLLPTCARCGEGLWERADWSPFRRGGATA